MECKIYDVGCQLGWLIDEIKNILLWFYEMIITGFAVVIEAIPVPEFLQNVAPMNLPAHVLWWTDMFQVGYGLAIVSTAYIARFVIRRIPLIG